MKTTKGKQFILLMLTLMMIAFSTNTVSAQVDENKAGQNSDRVITRVIQKEEVKEEVEVRFPNKLTAKEPPKDTNESGMASESDSKRNKGVATSPSNATATLTESVDNKNADYPVYRGLDGEGEANKYAADARQFITFKTKSGKTFHLIINHDENTENVMLLTEVSEDDLLNFVEVKEKKEEPIKEIIPQIEPEKEEMPEKEEKKSDFTTYILIFIIGLAVLGGGYYFKVIKRKEEEELKDFESDDSEEEYYSEYEGDSKEQNGEKEPKEFQNQETSADEAEYEDIDEEDLL